MCTVQDVFLIFCQVFRKDLIFKVFQSSRVERRKSIVDQFSFPIFSAGLSILVIFIKPIQIFNNKTLISVSLKNTIAIFFKSVVILKNPNSDFYSFFSLVIIPTRF